MEKNKMEEKNVNELEFEEVTSEDEEFNSLEDLEQQYIRSPKVGEKVTMTLRGFKVIREKEDLEFSFEKDGKKKTASNVLSSVDYGIQLHTDKKEIFWVNAWAVWGQLKAIGKKLSNSSLKGLTLEIDHAANGLEEANRDKAWIVKCQVEGEMKQLDRETKEWV